MTRQQTLMFSTIQCVGSQRKQCSLVVTHPAVSLCERHYRRERRRKDRERQPVRDDFSPAQIEARYLRALWRQSPAKAIRLAREQAA